MAVLHSVEIHFFLDLFQTRMVVQADTVLIRSTTEWQKCRIRRLTHIHSKMLLPSGNERYLVRHQF